MAVSKSAQVIASIDALATPGKQALLKLWASLREVLAPLSTSLGGTVTSDPASLAAGASATQAVTVTGAALGDYVLVAPSIANPGLTIVGSVTAANTVTVIYANNTAGAIDMLTHTLRVRVIPFNAFANALNLLA